MKAIHTLLLTATLCAATALPAHAAGQVEVNYLQPEQFSDAGRGIVDRQRTMDALSMYLRRLAARLPDGQTLRLDVTDIDLAGEIHPHHAHDFRVLRGGADWPHVNLRYTLLDGSRTLKAGEAKLADPGYMFGLRGFPHSDGELAYERRMLKVWFDTNFAAAR